MKKNRVVLQYIVLLLFLFVNSCKKNSVEAEITQPKHYENYQLVWNDEFNGTELDRTKWNVETGTGVNGDFGTGQLDRATDRKENISIVKNITNSDGGCLSITTRKEFYIDRNFTSGRINTNGKAEFGPGYKIEARIWANDVRYKGQGFAFWLMPAEKPVGQNYIMWPQGGEVDIMEYVGSIPYHNLGSVHYAWYWNNNQYADWNHTHKGAYYSYYSHDVPLASPSYIEFPPPANDTIAGCSGFHTYGINWFSNKMEFYVDGNIYHTHYFNDGDAFENGIPDGKDKDGVVTINGKRKFLSEYSNHFKEWHPFEHKFYLILSAGVGGNDNTTYGGAIVSDAQFPCFVYVDWVRVYKRIQ